MGVPTLYFNFIRRITQKVIICYLLIYKHILIKEEKIFIRLNQCKAHFFSQP